MPRIDKNTYIGKIAQSKNTSTYTSQFGQFATQIANTAIEYTQIAANIVASILFARIYFLNFCSTLSIFIFPMSINYFLLLFIIAQY